MRPKPRFFMMLATLVLGAWPLAEPPLTLALRVHATHTELREEGRPPVARRPSSRIHRWRRDQAGGLEVQIQSLSSGRRVYLLPRYRIADIGAAPAREADEVAGWLRRHHVTTLIWRRQDTRESVHWDRRLPREVRRVIVTGRLDASRSPRRRLWVAARNTDNDPRWLRFPLPRVPP